MAHDTKTARSAAKAGTLPGAGAVGGSAQWFDAARSVLYLHRGSEENSAIDRTLTALKVNNGVDGWVVPLAKDNSDEGVGILPHRRYEDSRHDNERRIVPGCIAFPR